MRSSSLSRSTITARHEECQGQHPRRACMQKELPPTYTETCHMSYHKQEVGPSATPTTSTIAIAPSSQLQCAPAQTSMCNRRTVLRQGDGLLRCMHYPLS
eukprot:10332-Eustigmatos_ZCMA.PRE.1